MKNTATKSRSRAKVDDNPKSSKVKKSSVKTKRSQEINGVSKGILQTKNATAIKGAGSNITWSGLTKIRVMISSKCDSEIKMQGLDNARMSDLRLKIKEQLEAETLLGVQLFSVWINEDAPSDAGDSDSWEVCMREAKRAHLLVVLYNGNAGWALENADVGICHAEMQAALDSAAAKVRLIELPTAQVGKNDSKERNKRFKEYVVANSLFRGMRATDGDSALKEVNKAVRQAVSDMVSLGVREAQRGKYYLGEALNWSRLDLVQRQKAMLSSMRIALLERTKAYEHKDHAIVEIAGSEVLLKCNAIPGPLNMAAARELVGQPFLDDFNTTPIMTGNIIGPLHIIACNRSVTETQGLRMLGFSDATVVRPPFGLYVADEIQNIQIIFLAECRDDTKTRTNIQRLFDWLRQSEEDKLLVARAGSRKEIVKTMAAEHMKRIH